MEDNKKEAIIDAVTDFAGPAIGATAGFGIGLVFAGPAGAAVGSLAGTAIEKAIEWAGNEIKERRLSTAENRKIGSVASAAVLKIDQNLKAGMTFRKDDFFEEKIGDRSSAEEILEGTLLAAQRENEEKKLPYLANLYANINFTEAVNRPMANQLLKFASDITYRQLVILSVIGKCNYGMVELSLRTKPFRGFSDYHDMSIAADIFDLYRRSLLISSSAILDAASFTPSLLVIQGMGELLFRYMELDALSSDDISDSVITFLVNDSEQETPAAIITTQLPDFILDEHTATWEDIDDVLSERVKKLEDEVSSMPKLDIRVEDNDSGGTTLILDGGTSFIDEHSVEKKLREI